MFLARRLQVLSGYEFGQAAQPLPFDGLDGTLLYANILLKCKVFWPHNLRSCCLWVSLFGRCCAITRVIRDYPWLIRRPDEAQAF